MGMTTYVVGVRDETSELYVKHRKVLEACADAGIRKLPTETALFFGDETVCMSLLSDKMEVKLPFTEKQDDSRMFYEVDIDSIPKDVKKIRFVNSY